MSIENSMQPSDQFVVGLDILVVFSHLKDSMIQGQYKQWNLWSFPTLTDF